MIKTVCKTVKIRYITLVTANHLSDFEMGLCYVQMLFLYPGLFIVKFRIMIRNVEEAQSIVL